MLKMLAECRSVAVILAQRHKDSGKNNFSFCDIPHRNVRSWRTFEQNFDLDKYIIKYVFLNTSLDCLC